MGLGLAVSASRISSAVPTRWPEEMVVWQDVVDVRCWMHDQVDAVGQPLPRRGVKTEPWLADVAGEHL